MSLNDFYITPNTMTRPLDDCLPDCLATSRSRSRSHSLPLSFHAALYLFECILKILKLDNCVVAVLVHDPASGVHMPIAVGEKIVKRGALEAMARRVDSQTIC